MFKTLIVEDNVLFRRSLNEILRARFPSMTITEARDRAEIYADFADAIPNLIFMDIRLPCDSGLLLTRAIKEDYVEVVIIVMTSHDMPEYRSAAFQCGASHFVSKKSSTMDEILSLVESIMHELPCTTA